MLRYVGSDDPGAFSDLIWSVGGSPPYGGVSHEEAGAVYELLEAHQGPGVASEQAFAKLDPYLDDALKRATIEIFRVRDRIASAPESFGAKEVAEGLRLADSLNHQGCGAYFTLLAAQLRYQEGNITEAKDLAFQALTMLAALTLKDQAYMRQMLAAGANGASFAAMDGDLPSARQVLDLLEGYGPDILEQYGISDAVKQLRGTVGTSPRQT
jgi:hypothetical protein